MAVLLQSLIKTENVMAHDYLIDPGKIFTIFFIMLGPLRFVDTYSVLTKDVPAEQRKMLALKTGLIAILALLIAGLLGAKLISSWNVMPTVLLLSVGVIFFVVAVAPVLRGEVKILGKLDSISPDELALHLVITPYGMAALIVLLSVAQDLQSMFIILGCLILVMIINVLFMAFKKPGSDTQKSLFSKIVSSVLGTMQFALAIQIIISSLNALGIISLKQ